MLMLMLMESHADELDDSPMDDDYEEEYRGCYAMLCYAMLCYAMLCYAMRCIATLSDIPIPC